MSRALHAGHLLRDQGIRPGTSLLAGSRRVSSIPKGLRNLLILIGYYILFPVVEVPLIGISLSAPLYGLLFGETMRRVRHWRYDEHRQLVRRATGLTIALLFSWAVGVALLGQQIRFTDLLLGLRLPYWVLCMVITAIIVGRTSDPSVYVRAMGWGVIGLGALRIGGAVFVDAWKVNKTLELTQNTYGLLFSTFWPFALTLVFHKRSKTWLAWGGAITLLAAIVVNASRGSWVTVACTTSAFMAAILFVVPGQRKKVSAVLVIALMLLTGRFLIVEFIPGSVREVYVERAQTFSNLDQDRSYQTRVAMRYKALALFKAHPLLGVGPGQFTRVKTNFDIPERLRGKSLESLNRRNSHSAYFQFLAETGIVGTGVFILLVGWLFVEGLRCALIALRNGLIWPMGLWLGFLGMSIHLIVISGLLGTLPWFVYGIVGGMIAWVRRVEWTLAAAARGRVANRGGRG